jgi:hypothetical protein
MAKGIKLARLQPVEERDYYTEIEAAQILGIAPGTLKKRRSLKRDHPPFIKMGWIIRFPKQEFQDWYNSRPLIQQEKDSSIVQAAEEVVYDTEMEGAENDNSR